MELRDFKSRNTRELTSEEKLQFVKVVKQVLIDLRIEGNVILRNMDDGMYLNKIIPEKVRGLKSKHIQICLLISCHVGEWNGKDTEQYSVMGWTDGELKFGNDKDDYMWDTDISEFYLKIMYYINNLLK